MIFHLNFFVGAILASYPQLPIQSRGRSSDLEVCTPFQIVD